MTSSEIRNSFLKFFEERAHTIVPSAPVVPYDDPTLLFANAGMNQFKDVFLGTGKRSYTRATDTQKCIRVSGKHNDLEEVGRDTYHHTFFEMLGNWSFGDPSEPDGIGRAGYYKKEAIEWAWELLTKVWGLPKNRLWATVYKDDQEAEQLWKSVTDIDPNHILRFGEKDNFWEMGETGPCGPCSEIHIDRTPDGTATASMVNAGIADVMEIWNLVFIQYNRDEAGKLTPLPAKHVDTGMGFERVCAVMQNKNSNYDTDVFTPIINKIAELTKQPYNGSLQSAIGNRQSEIDISMRVIADHVRTLTFAIGDGATPSNEGRGYVLRRILRRAARFGRNLGMHEPFIYQLVPTLVETMSYIFPEIKTNQDHIQRLIKGEEEGFNATLDIGLRVFKDIAFDTLYDTLRTECYSTSISYDEKSNEREILILAKSEESTKRDTSYLFKTGNIFIGSPTKEYDNKGKYKLQDWNLELSRQFLKTPPKINDRNAFKLYDTYGFPLDLTSLLAAERGFEVDANGFEKQMEDHRSYSRFNSEFDKVTELTIAHPGVHIPIKLGIDYITKDIKEDDLRFIGYDALEGTGIVVKSDGATLVVDSTPFYGEAGGQVGDTGIVEIDNNILNVIRTLRAGNTNVHVLEKELALAKGQSVKLKVDADRRLSIQRNHSATHLLHKALRQILGTHVQQAGSLVAPDYLSFDFSHFTKLTEKERSDIESLVNEKIKENIPRTPGLNNIPFDDAKKMGALMFFGDKYGERVNVVQFGDFSTEFCGGTHVNNTGEIGYFKIRSEESKASGVRRIEAVTHNYARELLISREKEYLELLTNVSNSINSMQEILKMFPSTSPISKMNTSNYDSELKELQKPLNIPTNIINDELNPRFHEQESRFQKLEDFKFRISKKEKELSIELMRVKSIDFSSEIDSFIKDAIVFKGIRIIGRRIKTDSVESLKAYGDTLRTKLGSGVGVIGMVNENEVKIICVVTHDLVADRIIHARYVIDEMKKLFGFKGGGQPHFATAGGKEVSMLDKAIEQTVSIVESLLKK